MTWAVTRGHRAASPRLAGPRWVRAAALALAVTAGLLSPAVTSAPADAAPSNQRWTYPSDTPLQRTCSDRVCVHRATSGPHAATSQWADLTLAFVEESWATIVDDLGFRAPASSPDASGDTRFHVYLADLSGAGQFGLTVTGDPVPGQERRARSYLTLDNDMEGLGDKAQAELAASAAHEFFHAVQLNVDSEEDRWFMEATATWGETQVFPSVHANRRYLHEGQLGQRGVPLDSMRGAYGNYVLLERLVAVAGRDAVREAWARLDASTGSLDEWSLQAVAAVLARRGISWHDFYTGFAVANVLPDRSYPARASRPAQRPDASVRLGPRRRSATQSVRMPHLTARSTEVRLSSRARKRRVALTVATTAPSTTGATLLVVRRDGSVRRVPMRFSAGGKARATVLVKRGKVRRLVLVTTNTSRAFRGCGRDSGWACGGDPVQDRTRVRVTARTRA